MKWGSMASKCAGRGVPFGYNPQRDRFVWLSSVPLDRYGEALRARLPVLRRQTAGRADCDQYTSSVLQVLQALIAVLVRWWVRVAAAQGSQGLFWPTRSAGVPPPDGLLGGRSAARIEDKRFRAMGSRLAADIRTGRPLCLSGDRVPYSARKKCTIEAVEVEMPQENGLRPDVVLTLKDSRGGSRQGCG